MKIVPFAWLLAAFAILVIACSGGLGDNETFVQAAKQGDLATVRQLLERGVDINAVDARQHATALMWAAHEGHTEIMQILIRNGADIHTRKSHGETALWFAAQQGRLEAVKMLAEQGADIKLRGWDDTSPLEVARRRGHAEIVAYLESQGAE